MLSNGNDTFSRRGEAWYLSTRGGSGVVDDQLNVPLEDSELLAEVELTTNLIIAASEADTTLSQAEVDKLLGIEPDPPPSIPTQQFRNH